MGRVLDPDLNGAADEDAARQSCELLDDFIDSIGLATDLKRLGVPESELTDLAKQSLVLPDYGSNPRVICPAEMETFLKRSFNRE